MVDVGKEAAQLLADKPELRSDLEAIVDIDDKSNTWQFSDVPVDSGIFGEIVARGIVEKTDDGYRVSHPAALKNVLKEGAEPDPTDETSETIHASILDKIPEVSQRKLGTVILAVLLIVSPRAYNFSNIFRKGDVVLMANDPWFYRYLVEEYVMAMAGPLDFGSLTSLGKTSPLFVASMGWFAKMIGGTPSAVGTVLSIYPVISSLLTAGLIYFTTVILTDSRFTGYFSVLILAVIPAHTFRTSLGFADHHAFDYLWLSFTVLFLVVLTKRKIDPKIGILCAVGVTFGIVAQVFSWRGGILLLPPIAGYFLLRVTSELRAGEAPIPQSLYEIVGLSFASIILVGGFLVLGWSRLGIIISVIAILGVTIGMVILGEFAYRLDISPTVAGISTALLSGLGIILVLWIPRSREIVDMGIGYFTRTTEAGVGEASSFGLFGLSPWLYLGFFILLAVIVLIRSITTVYRDHRPTLLLLVVYGGYFFVLALIQRRFLGEFSLFVAVFSAIGFVQLAGWLDIIPRINLVQPGPIPEIGFTFDKISDRIVPLILLFFLVASLSLVQIPVTVSQLTITPDQHDTAIRMADFGDDHGWEYPRNYVLSWWDRTRMYNYFVSFHSVPSLRYQYSRQNYVPFLSSTDPSPWYSRFEGKVGFVVTRNLDVQTTPPKDSIFVRLHERYGSRGDGVPGLAHYRLIFKSTGESVKAFAVVPGATISGSSSPNSSIEVSSNVSIPEESFAYKRQTTVKKSGNFSVTVPYPGTYHIGNQTLFVSEHAVMNGSKIHVAINNR